MSYKVFKVRVSANKVEFFKKLMDNLDFVNFLEESKDEVRVYPGADFEIRSGKKKKEKSDSEKVKGGMKKIQTREEAMENLRNAMSQIEKLRRK